MWVRQEWQTEMKTQCLRLYSDVIKRDRVHALFYFCSETLISISLAGSVQFWLFCKCNMRLSKFTRRSSDFMFSELTTALVFPLDQKRDLWLDVYLLEIESIQTSCLKEPIKFLVWCNHTDMGYPSLARVENPPTASNVLLVSVHSRKLDPPVMSTNIHFGFFFFFDVFAFYLISMRVKMDILWTQSYFWRTVCSCFPSAQLLWFESGTSFSFFEWVKPLGSGCAFPDHFRPCPLYSAGPRSYTSSYSCAVGRMAAGRTLRRPKHGSPMTLIRLLCTFCLLPELASIPPPHRFAFNPSLGISFCFCYVVSIALREKFEWLAASVESWPPGPGHAPRLCLLVNPTVFPCISLQGLP